MGYSVNPDCEVVVVSESCDDVDDDRKRRDVQPKYTADGISAIHGVSSLLMGRWAVGVPRFLEPRP